MFLDIYGLGCYWFSIGIFFCCLFGVMKFLLYIVVFCVGLFIVLVSVLVVFDVDVKFDLKDDKIEVFVLFVDVLVCQSMCLVGCILDYIVIVGILLVCDVRGKVIVDVVFIVYMMLGKDWLVIFVFNGGFGVLLVYFNMGVIGFKVVIFGFEGDSVLVLVMLYDNFGIWLDFIDLVFIDLVGIGFSCVCIGDDEVKKVLYNFSVDIEYLLCLIYDWLLCNQCMVLCKYLIGESYGGYRGLCIIYYLQIWLGVVMNGLVLVLLYLSLILEDNVDVLLMVWMQILLLIVVVYLECQGKLIDVVMCEVVEYICGDYVIVLMKGCSDLQVIEVMLCWVIELIGLDLQFVCCVGGWLEIQVYLWEVFCDKGMLGSCYDFNVIVFDLFLNDLEQCVNDLLLDSIIVLMIMVMVDFVMCVVGWKVDVWYQVLNYDVNWLWDCNGELCDGVVIQLCQVVVIDLYLQVLIVYGWNDLLCLFMGLILIVDQMLMMGSNLDWVQVCSYLGGYMFYSWVDSQVVFCRDVQVLF